MVTGILYFEAPLATAEFFGPADRAHLVQFRPQESRRTRQPQGRTIKVYDPNRAGPCSFACTLSSAPHHHQLTGRVLCACPANGVVQLAKLIRGLRTPIGYACRLAVFKELFERLSIEKGQSRCWAAQWSCGRGPPNEKHLPGISRTAPS